MEWLSRLKLDLEAVVEDASDEVYSFEIEGSLINFKLYISHYQIIDFYHNPPQRRIKSHHAQLVFGCQQ